MTREELREKVARAICREQCAFYGEPPCWEVGKGLSPQCDEPGCAAIADAAIALCMEEAATRIEALEKALREAKKGLDAMIGHYAAHNHVTGEVIAGDEQYPWVRLALIGRDAARAALGGK